MENCKMSDQIDETPSFASLPEIPLLKIFGFLNVRERVKAGRVCRRFYNLSKESSLWKHMVVQNLGEKQFMKLLPAIPSTVTHLTLSCDDIVNRTRLTQVLEKLSKLCSSLEALTLSYQYLLDYTEHAEITYPAPAKKAKGSYLDYYTEESNKVQYVFMPKLVVLSLRKVSFCLYDFFSFVDHSVLPKLEVIDLTESGISSKEYFQFFSRFRNLKEIYLAGTTLENKHIRALLEAAKGLTVLDLEAVSRGVRKLFPSLRQYGQSLEKLYLGMNSINDGDLSNLLFAEANSFPHLVELCFRSTGLTDTGIKILLNSCRSLRRVDVTLCDVSKDWLRCSSESINVKVIFEEDAARERRHCHHFRKNHFHVSTERSL